jgi:hypothetical protein
MTCKHDCGSSNDTGRAPSNFIASRETRKSPVAARKNARHANYGSRRLWPPTTPLGARLLQVGTTPLTTRGLLAKASRASFWTMFFIAIVCSSQHHGLIQAIAMTL